MTAKLIKALRKRLGDTQEAFAQRLGVSYVSVNRWENGHPISKLAQRAIEQLAKKSKKSAKHR